MPAGCEGVGFRGLKTNILIPGADGKLFQYSPASAAMPAGRSSTGTTGTRAAQAASRGTIRRCGRLQMLHLCHINFHFLMKNLPQ